MQHAARPFVTAGVALVGASLVAASTMAPVPDIRLPDIHVPGLHMANLSLAAAVNPLEVYSQVFHDAVANIGTLAENAQPGQVLAQIIANQIDSARTLADALQTAGGDIATATTTQVPPLLQNAAAQLRAGDVADAVNSLLTIPLLLALPAVVDLLPALQTVLTKPLQNLVNVITAFASDVLGTELILSGFIAPLISTPAAAAVAVQNVLDAIGTRDPAAVVSAVLTAPATIADGFLNGGKYGPDLGPLVGSPFPVKAGGLLSSPALAINPDGSVVLNTGGPIAALQQIRQKVADAIAPQPAAATQLARSAVTSIPTEGATTVTLSTANPPVSAPAAATPESNTTAGTGSTEATTQSANETENANTETTKTEAAPKTTPDTTTDGNESASSAKDSTTKVDTAEPSTGAQPTAKDVDVKTGNKVEPQTTARSDATKSGDAATSSTDHATSSEKASSTDNTNATASASGAEKGADSSSN